MTLVTTGPKTLANDKRQPVRVDHYRQGPYDALLTLSGGRSIGLLRQGPMLSAANLRFRLRSIERLEWTRSPSLTLVLTDSEQDARRAVRALADPSLHETTLVARTADLIAGGVRTPVFQQGGYGYPNTPTTLGANCPSPTPTRTRSTAAMSEQPCRSPQSSSTPRFRCSSPEPRSRHSTCSLPGRSAPPTN